MRDRGGDEGAVKTEFESSRWQALDCVDRSDTSGFDPRGRDASPLGGSGGMIQLCRLERALVGAYRTSCKKDKTPAVVDRVKLG
jgi:hypothetical protein